MSEPLASTNQQPCCVVTGNPVGTDTQNPLRPCPCLLCLAHRIGCQECERLEAKNAKLKVAIKKQTEGLEARVEVLQNENFKLQKALKEILVANDLDQACDIVIAVSEVSSGR